MTGWRLLADVVLVVHALFVAFVVLGQLAILGGLALRQSWARNFHLRVAHGVAIGIVVLQAWLGVLCPLTILENSLRARAGEAGYGESFIAWWLHRILFYEAEPWVFTAAYTAFGAIVLATWVFARPFPRQR